MKLLIFVGVLFSGIVCAGARASDPEAEARRILEAR